MQKIHASAAFRQFREYLTHIMTTNTLGNEQKRLKLANPVKISSISSSQHMPDSTQAEK